MMTRQDCYPCSETVSCSFTHTCWIQTTKGMCRVSGRGLPDLRISIWVLLSEDVTKQTPVSSPSALQTQNLFLTACLTTALCCEAFGRPSVTHLLVLLQRHSSWSSEPSSWRARTEGQAVLSCFPWGLPAEYLVSSCSRPSKAKGNLPGSDAEG